MDEFTVQRTCSRCNKKIIISKNNLNSGEFVKYKNSYYHTECFIEYANERISKNNRYSPAWQEALDNIDDCRIAARDAVKTTIFRDELNKYLLDQYKVATFSDYFWNVVSEVENGWYRKRRCKSIETEQLTEMWKYYQRELDNINRYNVEHGKGVIGEGRALYDLAVIMKNYEKIKKGIAEEKVRAEETARIDEPKIEYTKIQVQKETDGLGDISDLLDDLI